MERVKKAMDELCEALDAFAITKGVPRTQNLRPMLATMLSHLESLPDVEPGGTNATG